MNHLVRFTNAEGHKDHLFAGSQEEAISHIERLRNAEGASDISLNRLTPVPLEFRTWFKAEVGVADGGAAPPVQPVAVAAPTPAPVAAAAPMPTRVVAGDQRSGQPSSSIPVRAVTSTPAMAGAGGPAPVARAEVAKGLFTRS